MSTPEAQEALKIELLKAHRQSQASLLQAHIQATTAFSQAAIRGLFILNGGTAIAALSSDRLQPEAMMQILRLAAWGAVLAVACSGVGYLAQRANMAADLYAWHVGYCKTFGHDLRPRTRGEHHYLSYWLIWIAIFLFAASLGIFIYGLMNLPAHLFST